MPSHGLYLVGVGYSDNPDVDQLSHYKKIMLTSGHLPLNYSAFFLQKKDKLVETI